MKSIALAFGAIATLVAAQDISGLPECGQFCATDMLNGQAADLGCGAADIACLCQNRNFIYGLRDCSAVTCGSEEARRIVEFGVQICRENGVEITTGPGGDPTATATGGSSESASASASGDSTTTETEGGGSGSASDSVSTILSTISSDGEVITTPVATTTLGDESDTTTVTEGSGTATVTTPSTTVTSSSDVVSTITTDGTTLVTTLSTPASSDDATGSESDGSDSTATDGASTTESDGAAMPQQTIAPAGILVAGLAAFLL